MPEPVQPVAPRAQRSAAERSDDHAAIARLSDALLPALIAKLGATGLGELEVREGAWRVRLRRPGDVAPAAASRGRASAGERERAARSAPGQSGSHPQTGLTPVGPGPDHDGRAGRAGRELGDGRIVASSPAVGIFQPRPESRAGSKVRAGDRIGSVDMLGVPQEVVAPSDGVVGASLVEAGDAVEYGQDLILIEFASATPAEA